MQNNGVVNAVTKKLKMRPMTAKNNNSNPNNFFDGNNRVLTHGAPSSTFVGNGETTVDRTEYYLGGQATATQYQHSGTDQPTSQGGNHYILQSS